MKDAPASSEYVGRGYAKDAWNPSFPGPETVGTECPSLEARRYTQDSWVVYYRGRKIEGLRPPVSESLGGGYGKDSWKVF